MASTGHKAGTDEVAEIDANAVRALYSQLRQLKSNGWPKEDRASVNEIKPQVFGKHKHFFKLFEATRRQDVFLVRDVHAALGIGNDIDEALEILLDGAFLGEPVDLKLLVIEFGVDVEFYRCVRGFFTNRDVAASLHEFLTRTIAMPMAAMKVALAVVYAGVPDAEIEALSNLLCSSYEESTVAENELDIAQMFEEELARLKLLVIDPDREQVNRRIAAVQTSAAQIDVALDNVERTLKQIGDCVTHCASVKKDRDGKIVRGEIPETLPLPDGEEVVRYPTVRTVMAPPAAPKKELKREVPEDEEIQVLGVTKKRSTTPRFVKMAPAPPVQRMQTRLLPSYLPTVGVGEVVLARHEKSKFWFTATVLDVMSQRGGEEGEQQAPRSGQDYRLSKTTKRGVLVGEAKVRVRFEQQQGGNNGFGPPAGFVTVLDAGLVAFATPTEWMLPVGTRVCARFKDPDSRPPEGWFAGTVGEYPSSRNANRYLIFFDDGAAEYVDYEHVNRICAFRNGEPWRDVSDEGLGEFLQKYFDKYPEKAMVRAQSGHQLKVESNRMWWMAEVLNVDASLMQIRFRLEIAPTLDAQLSPPVDRRPAKELEWIYRGSTRLDLLYKKEQEEEEVKKRRVVDDQSASVPSNGRPTATRSAFRRTRRSRRVEYVELSGDDESRTSPTPMRQQTAKKSSASPAAKQVANLNKIPLVREMEQLSTKTDVRLRNRKRVVFTVHEECRRECLEKGGAVDEPERWRKSRWENPLLIPLLCGWERHQVRMRGERGKRCIYYVAPCGRRLKNAPDLVAFLRMTSSQLPIDLFSFDTGIRPFVRIETPPSLLIKSGDDFSRGREKLVKLPWKNSLSQETPPVIDYCANRFANTDVSLNVDGEFQSCCSCTDNCMDKTKCECQRLTVKYTSWLGPMFRQKKDAGYECRRLKDQLITGIFECNKNCGCDARCFNRVVQNPVQVRLEIFKTPKKGWGVRAVDDIPKGTFLSIYSGRIMTPTEAHHLGVQIGDEYHAGLDWIEVVQDAMYDDDFAGSDDDERESRNDTASEGELDEAESVQPAMKRSRSSNDAASIVTAVAAPSRFSTSGPSTSTASGSTLVLPGGDCEPSGKEKVERWIETAQQPENRTAVKGTNSSEFPRVRGERQQLRVSLFKEEESYVIDGKTHGNVGRYFNHSCAPNMFVQSVFVDTHDARFPWVAFFTMERVRAGTELCWDYNYVVDSVPDKKIYCHCGSPDCRRRML